MVKQKFSAKRIAFAGVMGALLVVSKFALSFIPNVEVVTTLLVAFCFVFGFDGVIASLIFCTADIILYPPALDVIVSYYIYWNLLAVTVAILKELNVKSFAPYFIMAFIFTALFGVLTSFFNSLFFGVNFGAVYVSGLYFYAIHLVSTSVFMVVGFNPVVKVLLKIKEKANL
jgi:hypothetical protein